MTRIVCIAWSLALAAIVAAPAVADLFIYPAKGQSPEQQAKDKGECQAWATQQTGFDPLTPPPQPSASEPPPSAAQEEGQVVRGAARGAALGAVVGAIAGDAGTGAAAGAAGGALMGGMRRRDARIENEQQQDAYRQRQQSAYQQALNAYNQKRATFERAMSTCLQGRGYTVN